MSQWLRLYTRVIDTPKVQKLPAETFRGWINLLCLTKEHGGHLPPVDDIAFRLRMSVRQASKLITSLRAANLIDENGELHDWDEMQFQSDDSTERVRRFRKRNRNDHGNAESNDLGNGDETFHGRPPLSPPHTPPLEPPTDSEAETEAETPQTPLSGGSVPRRAVDTWNQHRGALPECRALTEERRRKIRSRASHDPEAFLALLEEATKRAAASEFCRERGWMSFDWMIKNNTNMQKVLEGHYDERNGTGKTERRARALGIDPPVSSRGGGDS